MNSALRSCTTLLYTLLVAAAWCKDLAAPSPPEGFEAIFNGKDLTGWEGSPDYWSVKDGCLTGVTDGTLKYNRFIIWRGGTLKNFDLRVEVNGDADSYRNFFVKHFPLTISRGA